MIEASINYLGLRATDKITGAGGIVTSVCFDLYGCVQVCIEQGLDKEGTRKESYWYDIQRLRLDVADRVMPVPSFAARRAPETYDHGPADKPAPRR